MTGMDKARAAAVELAAQLGPGGLREQVVEFLKVTGGYEEPGVVGSIAPAEGVRSEPTPTAAGDSAASAPSASPDDGMVTCGTCGARHVAGSPHNNNCPENIPAS